MGQLLQANAVSLHVSPGRDAMQPLPLAIVSPLQPVQIQPEFVEMAAGAGIG